MVFTTAGGGASQLYPYEIDNSLRFNDGDSPKVSRSISSSGSARNATFSVWVKRGILGTRQQIYSNKTADSAFDGMNMYFNASNDRLYIDHHDGTNYKSLYANMQFRDVSAWYHIVHTIDTTTGTATNRLRLYVNGTEITSFATDQEPSQNADLAITNSTGDQSIGDDPRDSNDLFDGYMAEYNFVDGTTLDPTYFGEFNNNGVWIPKKPNVSSYGTNGFYLEFKQTGTSANSSGIGADTSGNDNHMSVTNLAATDVTTDTPTNNFATLNSVAPVGSYAEGNLRYTTSTTDGEWSTSTISISTNAKWYCEVKAISKTAGAGIYYQVGVTKGNASDFTYRALYRSDGAIYVGGSNTATFSSYTDNDIISIAYDSSNRNVTFYKNGNSEGTVTAPSLPSTSDDYFFGASSLSGGNTFITEWNFGNAPFTISSGNSDANGYGNFEYAVPSGYYSLCTKNLAEYG